jgi:hypothetical protein
MDDEQTTDNGPKELREALDRATARAEAAETGLKQFQAQTYFEKAGLGEKQASLFLKTNPDAEITSEAVGAFIEEYGFNVTQATPEPAPKEKEPVDKGLSAFSGAAGAATAGSAPPVQPKMSKTDFEKLLVENPQEAAAAYAKGLVERNPANVQAQHLVQKGIIDH